MEAKVKRVKYVIYGVSVLTIAQRRKGMQA